jgi:hypothetical protein
MYLTHISWPLFQAEPLQNSRTLVIYVRKSSSRYTTNDTHPEQRHSSFISWNATSYLLINRRLKPAQYT